jgi:putative component of membrane protein insertase Oxa1/YidC/SpoIIIJ protein YidD
VLAGTITAYQRYVSPHKGFCCAHNALHHRGSCSEFGKKVALRFGVWRFLRLMAVRFKECRSAYVALQTEAEKEKGREENEPGDCPVSPFSKECGYCGYAPCYCFPWPF